jgi:hypothetical protein
LIVFNFEFVRFLLDLELASGYRRVENHSVRWRRTWELRVGYFDPIAEASELPDHSGSALLLRSFGDRWAAFLVTDFLV